MSQLVAAAGRLWNVDLNRSTGLRVAPERIAFRTDREWVLRAGAGLTGDERAALALEEDDLCGHWLRAATRGEVGEHIAPLMTLPAGDQGEAVDLEVAVYVEVLVGLPVGPLGLAVRAILDGTAVCDGRPVSRRFRPTAAEIADVTRQKAVPAWTRRGELRRLLEAREERPIPERGPEHARRVEEKIAAFVGRAPSLDDPGRTQDVEADRRRALAAGGRE